MAVSLRMIKTQENHAVLRLRRMWADSLHVEPARHLRNKLAAPSPHLTNKYITPNVMYIEVN